jgi:hypothetical protein
MLAWLLLVLPLLLMWQLLLLTAAAHCCHARLRQASSIRQDM